jgi:hypothetical protein
MGISVFPASSGGDISSSLIAAKGNLLAGTAADTIAALAVGANGTVLTADSVETTGLKWATASNMTLLSTTTLSGATTAIENINQNYTHLFISAEDFYASSPGDLQIRLNNNSTADAYLAVHTGGDSGGVTLLSGVSLGTYYSIVGGASVAASDNNNVSTIWLYNYTNTSVRKQIQNESSFKRNFGGYEMATTDSGWWNNTSAINRVDFITNAGTFTQGTIKIYGVK